MLGLFPPTPLKPRPIKVSITCKSRASIFPPLEFASISVESVTKYKISFANSRFSTKSFEDANFSYNWASFPVASFSIAVYMLGTFPIVSTISPSSVFCVVSEASTGNQNSLIFLWVPSAKFTIAYSASIVPVELSIFCSLKTSRPIDVIPKASSVFNSPSDTPFWSASIHTRKWFHAESLLSIIPSLFSSNSVSAWKPEIDISPFSSCTWSPNNSPPSLISPSPLRSRTKNPSSLPIQAVFSAKPFLSRSKWTPFSMVVSSIPKPPRSITSGSRGGCALPACVYSSLSGSNMVSHISSPIIPIPILSTNISAQPTGPEHAAPVTSNPPKAPPAIPPSVLIPHLPSVSLALSTSPFWYCWYAVTKVVTTSTTSAPSPNTPTTLSTAPNLTPFFIFGTERLSGVSIGIVFPV